MATQTKTVAINAGISGLTSAFTAKESASATGVFTARAAVEITDDQSNLSGAYIVTLSYDDALASNEPIGRWFVSVGSATGVYGRVLVEFVAGVDEYSVSESGGASAEEIVEEFEDRGITTVSVQSGVTSATVLEVVQGDTYNGIGKPLLSFVVAVDYTDGWTATLTIRDEDDAIVLTVTGTIASSTSITFSMTAPTGLTMVGCPGSWKGKFDVQLSKASSRTTITRGTCYVYEDQTRT